MCEAFIKNIYTHKNICRFLIERRREGSKNWGQNIYKQNSCTDSLHPWPFRPCTVPIWHHVENKEKSSNFEIWFGKTKSFHHYVYSTPALIENFQCRKIIKALVRNTIFGNRRTIFESFRNKFGTDENFLLLNNLT